MRTMTRLWKRATGALFARMEVARLPEGIAGDVGLSGDVRRALARKRDGRAVELRCARAAGLAR